MSGIASQMQAHGAGEYLAGLWKDQLPYCLLWRYNPCVRSSLKFELGERFWPYRAPTWSRASLRLRRRKYANLGDAHCTPTGTDTLGAVSDGYIKLSGLLVAVRLANCGASPTIFLEPLNKQLSGYHMTVESDIELSTVGSDSIYCVLLAVDTRTCPISATGLILRASEITKVVWRGLVYLGYLDLRLKK